MKRCPYCGYSNYDNATQCRKCDGPFVSRPTTALSSKYYWVGPGKAHDLGRRQVLVAGTERAGFHIMREWRARLARHAHLFRALGALGGHDHPLFGEAVLAQLRHGGAG